MANPRKPNHLKVVAGTARPCREAPPAVELPLVSELPAAPSWLPQGLATEEWDRLTRILVANKLLADADLSALAHLCAVHAACARVHAAGDAPTASLQGLLRVMGSDFLLNPGARGKVVASGESKKQNAFSANKRTA